MFSLRDLVTAARAARTVPQRPARQRFHPRNRTRTVASVDAALWLVHERYAKDRRARDLDYLVDEYEPFTRSLARQYCRTSEPLDDLVQVAFEALVVSLRRFEPARRIPFVGYAQPTISGALKRHYRDHGWSIRLPRRVQSLARVVAHTSTWLAADLGRAPTARELADALGLDEPVVAEVLVAAAARQLKPLDERVPAIASDDEDLARFELRRALQECKRHLSIADLRLVDWYFEEGCSQATIATRLGCSQMEVSRQLRRVLASLRGLLG